MNRAYRSLDGHFSASSQSSSKLAARNWRCAHWLDVDDTRQGGLARLGNHTAFGPVRLLDDDQRTLFVSHSGSCVAANAVGLGTSCGIITTSIVSGQSDNRSLQRRCLADESSSVSMSHRYQSSHQTGLLLFGSVSSLSTSASGERQPSVRHLAITTLLTPGIYTKQ